MQSLVQIIDTLMVGRLGPEEIAAIGLGNTLRLFVFILVLSVSAGAMSLVAQAKGARDHKRISFITRQAISSGILVSLALGIVGIICAKPILTLMEQGGSEKVINLSYEYLVVLFIGTPFLLLNFVFEKIMQGAGDMKTPLLLNIAVIALNIFLNYIFIFGFGMIPALGVVGAAVGTVIARAIALGIGFYIFYSGMNVVKILPGTYLPDWQMFKDIFNIGLPSGVQGLFRRGSNIFLIGVVTATELGTFGAAALAIGWQIEQLIIQPIVGLNVAGTSLVGQALGRWQVKDAISKGNILISLGVVICTLLVLPPVIFPEYFVRLFDPSAHELVLKGTFGFFRIAMLSVPIAAISVIITGIMRGAGDTKPPMYSTLIFRNVVTIGLAYILAFPAGLGSYGVWYAIVFGRLGDTAVMLFIWVRKKWLNVSIELTEIFRTHLYKLDKSALSKYLEEVRAPLMASRGTQEIIKANRVIYRANGRDQIVLFKNGGFKKVET